MRWVLLLYEVSLVGIFTGAHECSATSCLSLPKQRHLNGGSDTNSNMWQGRSETIRLKKAGRVNVSSDG